MGTPSGNTGGMGDMPHFGDGQSFSYNYHGDPRATFSQFFGNSNPFESFFTGGPGMGSNMDIDEILGGFGGGNMQGQFRPQGSSQKPRKQPRNKIQLLKEMFLLT